MSSVLVDLENVWSSHSQRGKNLYLYWAKKPNSQNHGHVFYHKDHKKWYYNIKCNNNKGNDRIRHNITKNRAKTLKNKIKKDWRTECPQFIRSVSKIRKSKTVKKK
jgi:hypothetical protein